MKKALACAALTLAFVAAVPQITRRIETRRFESLGALFHSHPDDQGGAQPQSGAPSYSEQLASDGASDTLETTLYFRFGQTNVLGAQRARLDLRRDEAIASLIVERLIEGPTASHDKLSGLFPQGTRLLSVSGEGSTAFVTLSSGFLGAPDGAPSGWEDSTAWQEEAALRRSLAVQSIVLSLTEGGRYQRVQLYVADSDDDLPRRVELYWFDTKETQTGPVLGACGRDETLLLTPKRALTMILDAWQRKDWAALYALLDVRDGAMPSPGAFEQEMRALDVTLLTYAVSDGAVGLDGQSATLVLDAQLRSAGGGDALIEREAVPLARIADNWAMTPETLHALMVRD